VSAEITIDSPRESVFSFLIELANRPSFTDHFISSYRLERIPSSGVGAAARFRTGPRLSRVWMESVVDELEKPYRIVERGHCGRSDRIPAFTAWELVPGAGSTTEVSVAFWTEPTHHVDRMRERLGARGWYHRRWGRALRRLKQGLEEGGPVERIAVAGEDRVPTLPSAVRH
jgi:uncharacterized protein YndB with AHSA1/START domain